MYTNAQLTAMAHMIAEHEVMRDKLIELGKLSVGLPLRWKATGQPIVNLAETIKQFMEKKNAGNFPAPSIPEPPDCPYGEY